MKLQVKNSKIVRSDTGKQVHLRGANIVRYAWHHPTSSASKSWTHDIAAALDFTAPVSKGGWGANCFTIWIDNKPLLERHPAYMHWLDGMVEVAVANGAWVMLSWHGETGTGGHPPHITTRGMDAMAHAAKRYRTVDNVFYACQAEPGFSTSKVSRWNELRDEQEQMIDAIRSEDKDAFVLVSGSNWSQEVHWMLASPVNRPNIGVKPHLYAPMPEVMKGRRIPEIAARWPVVIGEMGTGGRMNANDTREMIAYTEEHLSGWQTWNFAEIGIPVMMIEMQGVVPNEYGQAVKSQLIEIVTPPSEPVIEVPDPVLIPFRVNAGDSRQDFQDENTGVWLRDQRWSETVSYGYEGPGRSAAHGVEVAGGESGLHTTERWGMESYRIRVPRDHRYDVVLHVPETWAGITADGQRVFSVSVSGKSMEIDPYAMAGFATNLHVTLVDVEPVDGELVIRFASVVEQPMVKAIEVHVHEEDKPPVEPPPPDTEEEKAALREEVRRLNVELAQVVGTKSQLQQKIEQALAALSQGAR